MTAYFFRNILQTLLFDLLKHLQMSQKVCRIDTKNQSLKKNYAVNKSVTTTDLVTVTKKSINITNYFSAYVIF